MRYYTGFFAFLLFALFSQAAYAHNIESEFAGFYEGFIHPITGIDHLLVMISVGLWASQKDKKIIRVLPGLFVACLLLGFWIGTQQTPTPIVEMMIALSVVILGLLLSKSHIHTVFSCFLINLFAIFHGHAHGTEFSNTAQWLEYGLGLILTTSLLYGTGLVIGFVVNHSSSTVKFKIFQLGGLAVAITGGVLLQALEIN